MSNERIEELAWDLCEIPKHPSIKSCEQCGNKHCLAMYYAKRAYGKDYRKATDVVEEIFEVIEDKLTDKIQYWMEKAEGIKSQYEAGYLYERISTIEDLLNLLGEIKEKYTEGK